MLHPARMNGGTEVLKVGKTHSVTSSLQPPKQKAQSRRTPPGGCHKETYEVHHRDPHHGLSCCRLRSSRPRVSPLRLTPCETKPRVARACVRNRFHLIAHRAGFRWTFANAVSNSTPTLRQLVVLDMTCPLRRARALQPMMRRGS